MTHTESMCLDERIAMVLDGACPAFYRVKHGGPALWHQCRCKAVVIGFCECVRQTQSSCRAGTWPQLAFVDEYWAAEKAKAKIELERAKDAIAKAEADF